MGLLKRIFGICETKPPGNSACWEYAGGKIEIDLERAPELSVAGCAIRLESNVLPEKVLVLHGTDEKYYAFRNKCTHMGRRIDPLEGSPNIRCCSVSKSTFDYEGNLISGPAKGPLKPFQTDAANGKLTIII